MAHTATASAVDPVKVATEKLKKANTEALKAKLVKYGYDSKDVQSWSRDDMISVRLKLKGLLPGDVPPRTVVKPKSEMSEMMMFISQMTAQAAAAEKLRRDEMAAAERQRREEIAAQLAAVASAEQLRREEIAAQTATALAAAAAAQEAERARREEQAAAIQLERARLDEERRRFDEELRFRDETARRRDDMEKERHADQANDRVNNRTRAAERESDRNNVIKQYGGILKNVLPKMTDKEEDLPVYIQMVQGIFETYRVPAVVRTALMMPYITTKASRLDRKSVV